MSLLTKDHANDEDCQAGEVQAGRVPDLGQRVEGDQEEEDDAGEGGSVEEGDTE